MVEKFAVIGGGLMGSGIAEVTAKAGIDTIVAEISADAAAAAKAKVEGSIERAVSRGKLESSDAEAVLGRITYVDDLDALADRDLVLEAASENEKIKLELFERVGGLLGPDAILASNTSSIPISNLGAASGRPDKVLGIHFFNPAPVMQLVELIPSLTTSPETLSTVKTFVADTLGKEPIEATDRAGFVVNALLVPYIFSAIRMFEGGHATAEDIDTGMKLGCGHPMGPLTLADMVGLDTLRAIGDSMYDEFKEPLYAAPPLLERMVAAGRLGKKSGHGFYTY